MFDPYLEHLQELIKQNGGKPMKVPHGLEKCISKKSIIKNWLWKTPGFRRWRVTRLDAGNILQVLNSVAYPNYTNDQPILGIDLLWFGKSSKLVAVLDFQPLIQDNDYFERHLQSLKTLRFNFPELTNQQEMHAFDPHQYFSPWLLFCKGGIEHAENSLPKAFPAFLDTYLNHQEKVSKKQSIINPIQVENLQSKYNKYSAERDPAHALFKSYFGKEWSDRFLREFLFPS